MTPFAHLEKSAARGDQIAKFLKQLATKRDPRLARMAEFMGAPIQTAAEKSNLLGEVARKGTVPFPSLMGEYRNAMADYTKGIRANMQPRDIEGVANLKSLIRLHANPGRGMSNIVNAIAG